MAESLLSAAFVLCVYMVSVGYLLTHYDLDRLGVMIVILAPIIFLLFSQLSDAKKRREVEQITGERLLAGGIGCGIVTLLAAIAMPQLPGAITMFVAAWATFISILFLTMNRH